MRELEIRKGGVDSTSISTSLVLVEDQVDVRELLESILAGCGIEVLTAEDGEEGLRLIREQRPEVAVIDIGLPGISGLELARLARRELPPERLRLIALTGLGQHADRQAIYRAGFDQHLVKPVDVDVLLDVIRTELVSLRKSS
jgi:two-component system CheB/CheR fusion protein